MSRHSTIEISVSRGVWELELPPPNRNPLFEAEYKIP